MKWIVVLMFVIFAFPAFADVGPSPSPPELTITFTGDITDYSGNMSVIYHCSVAQNPLDNESMVGEREIELFYKEFHEYGEYGGEVVYTNQYWFYKLNPCFDSGEGYITYEYGNRTYESESFTFPSRGADIFVGILTGEVTATPKPLDEAECALMFGLPAIALFVLLTRNREWK